MFSLMTVWTINDFCWFLPCISIIFLLVAIHTYTVRHIRAANNPARTTSAADHNTYGTMMVTNQIQQVSVHEDQASCTSWSLMLPSQVCFAAARTQSIIFASLHIFPVMQGKACATLLELNGILVFDLVAVVIAIWLDTAFICLGKHDITCNTHILEQSIMPMICCYGLPCVSP